MKSLITLNIHIITSCLNGVNKEQKIIDFNFEELVFSSPYYSIFANEIYLIKQIDDLKR